MAVPYEQRSAFLYSIYLSQPRVVVPLPTLPKDRFSMPGRPSPLARLLLALVPTATNLEASARLPTMFQSPVLGFQRPSTQGKGGAADVMDSRVPPPATAQLVKAWAKGPKGQSYLSAGIHPLGLSPNRPSTPHCTRPSPFQTTRHDSHLPHPMPMSKPPLTTSPPKSWAHAQQLLASELS